MSMPTPTLHAFVPSRSAGALAPSHDADLAFDPVQIAWVDRSRRDDLDPVGEDPLAHRPDLMAERGLTLRPWRTGDVPAFRALLDDPAVWTHLPERYPDPLDDKAAATLIALANTLDTHLVRAVCLGGTPVGQVRLDLAPGRGLAEISYWLGRAHWGRGLGKAAVAGATARAFDRMPGLLRVVAKVRPGNAASDRVLERAGYAPCTGSPLPGFDDWRWYALRRQDRHGYRAPGIRSEASP